MAKVRKEVNDILLIINYGLLSLISIPHLSLPLPMLGKFPTQFPFLIHLKAWLTSILSQLRS